jgi:hypothetical protein
MCGKVIVMGEKVEVNELMHRDFVHWPIEDVLPIGKVLVLTDLMTGMMRVAKTAEEKHSGDE